MSKGILTWDDVNVTHKTLSGVHIKDGQVVSLLLSSQGRHQEYENKVDGDQIKYHIRKGTKNGDEWVRALNEAIKFKSKIKVFFKHGTNQWEDLGTYRVISVQETKEDSYYSLKKSN